MGWRQTGSIEDAAFRARLFLWVFGWGFPLALTGGIGALLALILWGGQTAALLAVAMLVIGYIPAAFAVWAGQRGRALLPASYLFVGHLHLAVAVLVMLFGPDFPLYGAFLIPLMMSLFVLPLRATVGIVVTGIGVTVFSILLWGHTPAPIELAPDSRVLFSLATWTLLIAIVAMLVIALVRQLQSALDIAASRTMALEAALVDVRRGRDAAERVVREGAMVVAQLNEAAAAQACAADQQIADTTTAATAIVELNAATQEIAAIATHVRDRATHTLYVAMNVRDSADAADAVGQAGQDAVQKTVWGIEQVALHTEIASAQLVRLHERLNDIARVHIALTAFAADLRLIGFNASIEAVIPEGGRFAVVAQEVTRVAERFGELVDVAQRGMAEVEATLAAVVLNADTGKKLTTAAVEMAGEAGHRFDAVMRVLDDQTVQAGLIVDAAMAVHDSCTTIAAATLQQQATVGGIGQTMIGVRAGSTDVLALTGRVTRASDALRVLTHAVAPLGHADKVAA